MDTKLPGLNIHNALLSKNPVIFNIKSLKIELQRKREECDWSDDYLNQMKLDSDDIYDLERHTARIIREQNCPLDAVLSIVLNRIGLDYWKQWDTLLASRPSNGVSLATIRPKMSLPSDRLEELLQYRPWSVQAQPLSKSEIRPKIVVTNHAASRFTPINGQRGTNVAPSLQLDPTSVQAAPRVKSRKVTKSGPRQSKRLSPHEPDAEGSARRPHHERVCWNLAYWLQDRNSNIDLKKNYGELEKFAGNLLPFHNAGDKNGLKPTEEEFIRSSRIDMSEYRSLRARILIGCAMIYEHNLRGFRLNERMNEDVARRPNGKEKFRPSNIGRAQAQLLGYGSDVKKASQVYDECVGAGYIPDVTDIDMRIVKKDGAIYCASQVVEACFPEEARKRLYRDLEDWYAAYRHEGKEIPLDLRFVISEPYP